MTKNTTELLQESDLENVTGGFDEVEIHLCPPSGASRRQNGTIIGPGASGGPHVKGQQEGDSFTGCGDGVVRAV